MPQTLEEIAEAGIAAHEKFVKDMRDIDYYWINGRLKEWIANQIPPLEVTGNGDTRADSQAE